MKKKSISAKLSNLDLAKKIANCLSEKKAVNILVLDLQGKSDITDFFVIASGTSTTHIKSMPDYIKSELSKIGAKPLRREGVLKDTKWSVIDYGFAIVHIFSQDLRDEYCIEKLWKDAKKVKWEEKSSADSKK